MSDLILLYGLPGAGKSTRIRHHHEAGFQVFDDFMAGSIDDKPFFLYCRRLGDIITALRHKHPCLLADIRLCDPTFRHEVVSEIEALVNTVRVIWHCFDCTNLESVNRCRRNVRNRERLSGRLEPDTFKRIDKFAPMFTLETDAVILEVIEASDQSKTAPL